MTSRGCWQISMALRFDDTGYWIKGILEVKTTSVYNLEAWQEGPSPITTYASRSGTLALQDCLRLSLCAAVCACCTKVKQALYAQIFLLLGKNTQAMTTTHTIVFSTSARRSCDFDKLMEKYPEVYKDCVTATLSNSLKIK